MLLKPIFASESILRSIHKYVTRVIERSQHPHNAKYEEDKED